jgi:hypothetical protein
MVGKLLKRYFLRELPEGKRERESWKTKECGERTKIEAN